MSAATHTLLQRPLAAEWERIELLGQILLQAREGRQTESAQLEHLQQLQQQVERNRAPFGAWQSAGFPSLSALEHDILACAVAVELQPRLGWLFQSLQSGTPQSYPTAALLQELLALDVSELPAFHAALAEDGILRRGRWIRWEGDDPFQPLRPGIGVSGRLLGRAPVEVPPPGAIRMRKQAAWEDLVLPCDRLAMLREFLLWIEHRHTVVEQWGGAVAGGPVALFAGPSGTGKTLSAAVLANELKWPLYRVDLGRLVSKYIGETEKNLNSLFEAAHGQPMVLQFDEADSLFSKRGEVKEARDRYANMEVSHLLARIEEHDGPCILTTNLRSHLDQAFARRFQVVVEFTRPDAAGRAQLWARLLPPQAPREADVNPEFLGMSVNLTGGAIRNAALHAAYLAAGSGQPIGLAHLALAVWRELGKDGRETVRCDLGPLAAYLPEGY